MTVAHVLYENEDWLPPLRAALTARGVPFVERFVDGGVLSPADLPAGVFVNRMSPSSHTRGHQGGVIYTRELLAMLEAAGRRVINGSRAFALELSKVHQDAALRGAGILTPVTLGVVAADAKAASRQLEAPFITKHNQGGKGLGVQLFTSHAAFDAFVDGGGLDDGGSPDGVLVLQQYIRPAEGFITRVEIVDGVFQYAIRSSTEGGFELCPADACQVDDAFCPVGENAASKFSRDVSITADDPLVKQYIALLAANQIDVAGIEFVTGEDGRRYTYDINGTTNFNATVEAEYGLHGMGAIADLIAAALAADEARGATAAAI